MTPEELRKKLFPKNPSRVFAESMAEHFKNIETTPEQEMKYESPIRIIYGKIETQLENDITGAVNAVLPYEIQINREELLKVLTFDRHQYEKGWEDSRKTFQRPKGEWIYERPNNTTYSDFVYCSECRKPNGFYITNFCPNCGADMRPEEQEEDT